MCVCMCVWGTKVSGTSRRKLVDADNDVYDNDDDDDDNDDHYDKTVEQRYMRRQWIGKTTMVAKIDNNDTSTYDTVSVCVEWVWGSHRKEEYL